MWIAWNNGRDGVLRDYYVYYIMQSGSVQNKRQCHNIKYQNSIVAQTVKGDVCCLENSRCSEALNPSSIKDTSRRVICMRWHSFQPNTI